MPVAVCATMRLEFPIQLVDSKHFSALQLPLVLLMSVCPFILLLGKSINQSRVSPVFQQTVDSPSVVLVSPTGSGCRKSHLLRYILVVSVHRTCVW